MNVISKIFTMARTRSASSASSNDVVPSLTEAQIRNVCVLVEALDTFASSASMYTVNGDETRAHDLAMMLNKASFNSDDLDAFVDVELNLPIVAGALKEYLSTHAPIIPYSLYEDFINPYTELSHVLSTISHTAGYTLLEKLVYHWANFFERNGAIDGALNFIQNKLGFLILRSDNAKRNEDTIVERYTAFSRLLKTRDKVFRHDNAPLDPSPHLASASPERPPSEKQAQRSPSPGKKNDANSASVPDRSVKITVPKGEDPLDDDAVFDAASVFGEIVHIGSKGKSKFVLFTHLEEAARCMRGWDGENNALRYCKIAYLGDPALLDSVTPEVPSAISSAVAVAEEQQHNREAAEEKSSAEAHMGLNDDQIDTPTASAEQVSLAPDSGNNIEVVDAVQDDGADGMNAQVGDPIVEDRRAPDEATTANPRADSPLADSIPIETTAALGAPRVWADARDKRPMKAPKPVVVKPSLNEEIIASVDEESIPDTAYVNETPMHSEHLNLETSIEQANPSPQRVNPIKDLPRSPERRELRIKNDDFSFMTELPAPLSSSPGSTRAAADTSPRKSVGHSSDVAIALNRWGRLHSGHVFDNLGLPSNSENKDNDVIDTVAMKLTRTLARDEGGAYQTVLRRPMHLAPRSPGEAPASPPPASHGVQVPAPLEDKIVQKSDSLIVHARPALIGPASENNRRATYVPTSIRDQYFKSSAPTSIVDFITDDNAHVAILESRVRSLEAEIKARMDSARLLDAERKRAEEQWAKELSAAQILAGEREAEVQKLNDTIRLLRSDRAHKEGELASLKAIAETQEASLKAIRSRADREALSTVLSQQRLISLLESERDELTKKATSLSTANTELDEENKKLQLELLDWRTKAIASEQLLQNIIATHADLSAHVAMGKMVGGGAGIGSSGNRASYFAEKVDAVERARSYLEKKQVLSAPSDAPPNGAPDAAASATPAPVHAKEPVRAEQSRAAASSTQPNLHIADMLAMKYAGGVVDVNVSNRIRDELMSTRPWLDNLVVPRGRPYGGSSTAAAAYPMASSGTRPSYGGAPSMPNGYRPKTKELQSWIRGEY